MMTKKDKDEMLLDELKTDYRAGNFDTKKKPQKKDKAFVWVKSSTGKYKLVWQTK